MGNDSVMYAGNSDSAVAVRCTVFLVHLQKCEK